MAPFPPTATCVLPMNVTEYYNIQDQPAFRSLLAQVRGRVTGPGCLKSAGALADTEGLLLLHR